MKLIQPLILLLFVAAAHGQVVNAKKDNARIKGENLEGSAVDLDAPVTDVNSALVRYLKGLGKVKQGEQITLTESTINGKTYTLPIYGMTKDRTSGAQAWLGVDVKEWGEEANTINRELEKLIYEFGVQFYRDKIQLQIDESTRALNAVERQQQRLTTQNRDLNTKVEDNKREKIQLEKAIENNKVELETLLKRIEKNKKDQDSVALAHEQIKKVIELQKDKQNKVH